MRKIGYARVSSRDQNLDRQINQMNNFNTDLIYTEKMSGENRERPQLKSLLKNIKDGDEIVVCSLDRLGRNATDIKNIMNEIKNKGASLTVLDFPSFNNIQNKNLRNLLNSLIIDLFSYVAENERETIRFRQKQGIEIAKKKGLYKGRKAKFNFNNPCLYKAIDMFNNRHINKLSANEIASQHGMSRSTLYRKIKELKNDI